MRFYSPLLILTIILTFLQISCSTPEENVTAVPTLPLFPTDESRIAAPTNTPQVEIQSNHLVICMEQEPETLFWYARETIFEDAVLHGIFENDITTLSYDYQAAGLERIPSFINGDAIIRVVPVDEGDKVVDVNGDVIELEVGSRVVDADEEISTYDGTTLLMNQMVVDFKMKQRAWSDGQPVTAADSVYSFHLAATPDTPGDKFLVDRTASYQATGNLQVRWTGLPGFINNNFQSYFHHPLPRHTWLDLTLAELSTADASSRFPVGDGPFRITEWEPGEHILLEPNPFYYRTSDLYPRLDGVTFRFIADTNQRIAQLLAGDCQVITHDGLDADLIPFFLEAESEQLLKAFIVPDRIGWEIVFGINSWGDYGDNLGRPDWFEDVRIRQAIAMCIDRQQIVDTIYYGYTEVLNSYVPSQHPLIALDVTRWPYDPTAANLLLDEVGYIDINGDGVREDPNSGADFHISLITGINQREHEIALMIKNYLQECGVTLFIERTADQSVASDNEVDKVFGRRFDLALSLTEDGHTPACERFSSEQISGSPNQINPQTNEPFIGWDGFNHSGWSNPTYDAICAAALRAPLDSPEQKSNHQQAQRIFSEELPVLPLALEPKITVAHPQIHHISSNPTQDSELWNLYAIEIVP